MKNNLVIFDGTSHFVEQSGYELQEDESVVDSFNNIDLAFQKAEELNIECTDPVR